VEQYCTSTARKLETVSSLESQTHHACQCWSFQLISNKAWKEKTCKVKRSRNTYICGKTNLCYLPSQICIFITTASPRTDFEW